MKSAICSGLTFFFVRGNHYLALHRILAGKNGLCLYEVMVILSKMAAILEYLRNQTKLLTKRYVEATAMEHIYS